MKSRTGMVLLFVAFASILALATAFEPEVVATNPKLASFTEAFYPPQVLNVTDGVYVARGYNRDNPVLIEGTDGLIVIDSLIDYPCLGIPWPSVILDPEGDVGIFRETFSLNGEFVCPAAVSAAEIAGADHGKGILWA